MPELQKYFSQFDGDTMWYEKDGKKYSGTCVEACLKMVDCYLTGREISISDIVKNGDNNPAITNFAGANKSANWLGFNLHEHKPIYPKMIKEFLGYGHLIIAIIQYNYIPGTHRQISFEGGHAILITGINEKNNSIRYADPAFSGSRRDEGFLNNNKWIGWNELLKAWEYYGFMAWEVQKSKEEPKPVPTPKPTPDPKDEEIKNLKNEVQTLLNDIFSTPTKEYVKGQPKKAGWEYRVKVSEGNASESEKQAKEAGKKAIEIEKKLSATTELLNKKIEAIEGLKSDIVKIKEEKDIQLARNVTLDQKNQDLLKENGELRKQIIKLTEQQNDDEDLENIFVRLFKKFISIFKKANT